ncbi:transcription factor [Lobaria immixta]|nr:transcription factor [Lobaria immixta]
MPSSSRRQVRKRVAAKRKVSDAGIADSSPSHSAAKKRKTNRGAPPEPVRADSPDVHPPPHDDDSDDTTSNAEQQELADAVIPHLAAANDPIVAAMEWANTSIEDNTGSVSAFAKVCGRDWTYYVKRLTVNIGRPPDALSRQSTGHGAESSPAILDEESNAIHIDLGPSKLVSRLHAELVFNHDDFKWHVVVHGRNGVKVNDTSYRRGQKIQIDSGDVLEIAGTQMMFVGASGQAVIHPMFLQKLHKETREDPEPDAVNSQAHPHPEGSGPRGRQPSSQTLIGARTRVNGQAVIAPAPPNFVRQTTPETSPRKAMQAGSGKKRSPPFGRGIVIETNELVDYSSDSAKDMKPGLSYATMISQAILSTPEQYLSLKGIYAWIAANFSYYRHLKTNWQNSIRHNLSLNSAFHKFPRGTNEPGKGSNWCLNPEKREELLATAEKQLKKSGARPCSTPSSPAVKISSLGPASSSSQSYVPASNGDVKASPTERTPSLTSYPPTAPESYTPSRGPHISTYDNPQSLPVLSDDPSPNPQRLPHGRTALQTGSSPTLTSGTWISDHPPLMTPAPRKHNLNLPLPNTVKLPTSHMPDSSPAPFWKYNDQPLSTPAKWPELSPLKVGSLQSSSPPPAATNANESPTRRRGDLPPSIRKPVEAEDEEGGIDLAR